MARRIRGQPTWTPGVDDFAATLANQNPWGGGEGVPEVLAPPNERSLAQELWRRLLADSPRRFFLVVGPRRVGKTTCLYQTVRHLLAQGISATRIWWLRLDDPLLMQVPMRTLMASIVKWSQATSEAPAYVFLDELTYTADWDHWLKSFYDEGWPVRIVASSSATAALRKGSHESGVGRWDQLYLPPYSFSDYLELIGAPVALPVQDTLGATLRAVTTSMPELPKDLELRLRRFILTGGFPELLLAGAKTSAAKENDDVLRFQIRLRDDAVLRAIHMDIPQTFSIDNPILLERMLYTLGGQLAGILSPTKICSALEMTRPTFDKYLSYLEQTSLVFTTQSYSLAERNVQKRGRKLYFVDGAVRNAALQRGPRPLASPEEEGLLLENAVASHLHSLAELRQNRLYHWHEDSKSEVDLLLDEPDSPLAFEVGRGADHHLRGMQALIARYPRFKGNCYLVSPDVRLPVAADRAESGIGSVPLALLLLVIGAQAQAALRVRLG